MKGGGVIQERLWEMKKRGGVNCVTSLTAGKFRTYTTEKT